MRLLNYLRCSLGRHAPQHFRVNWNGARFCGTCCDCGKPIERIARGRWRLDQDRIRER